MSTLTVKAIAAPVGYDLQMPAGHILQVVSLNRTNTQNGGYFLTTTATSFTASALTLAITPTSSSSKILVLINTHLYSENAASDLTIYRNSTNLGGTNRGFAQSTFQDGWKNISVQCLDSPSTTSEVTYKLGARADSGGTAYIGADTDCVNTITLMEVAG
jgi:hypothetical protein